MNPLQSPLNPQAPRPESTPIPGQPLQSQGMPMGQDPSMMPGEEFATPEERAQLQELLEATRDRMSGLRTQEFASSNSYDAAKNDVLRELFSMMQSSGVDLASAESVSMFINKIKESNPNMADDFEEMLNALIGDDETALMDPNETISENIPGPLPLN